MPKAKQKGLQLNKLKKPKKCEPFKPCVGYLGRIVSADGYTMNPADIAAVAANKETKAKTVGTLPKLLGFISSYHQYICDFSRLANLFVNCLQPKNVVTNPTNAKKERSIPRGSYWH